MIVDTEPTAIERVVPGTGRAFPARPSERLPRPERGSPGPKDGAGQSERRGAWAYDRGTQVCCHAQGGAANNWAFGYHGHGSRYAEACLDAVRREAEACDRLAGLCVLHSSAGGTGSGLGTYLTEVRARVRAFGCRTMARFLLRGILRGCRPGCDSTDGISSVEREIKYSGP